MESFREPSVVKRKKIGGGIESVPVMSGFRPKAEGPIPAPPFYDSPLNFGCKTEKRGQGIKWVNLEKKRTLSS